MEQLIGEITTLRIEQALAPLTGLLIRKECRSCAVIEINEKSPGEFNDIASLVTKRLVM